MEIRKSELLRYLGYRGQSIDEVTEGKIERAISLCLEKSSPKVEVRRFSLSGRELVGTNFSLQGDDIMAHLSGCNEVFLICATLGFGIEREISRLFQSDATLAVCLDSAATCLIESYLDDVCEQLEKKCALPLTDRFSCGYGDFPLQSQKEVCALLETNKRLGVYVLKSMLLSPQKSVTAFIGIGARRKSGCSNKCSLCKNENCKFRSL